MAKVLASKVFKARKSAVFPPLVMLHGLFGNKYNFRSAVSSTILSEKRDVICVDLRNHGESFHNHEEMTLARLAGDVQDTLEFHNLLEVDLLGHSLGGKVTMAFASRHPEFLRRAIVVDMAPITYGHAGHVQWHTVAAIVRAVAEIDLSALRTRGEIDHELAKDVENPMVRAFVMQNLVSRSDGTYTWRVNASTIYRSLPLLANFEEFPAPVHLPTLFLAGGKSDYVTENDVSAIDDRFDDAYYHVIPEAGHWVHAEKPREFVSAVEQFLDSDLSALSHLRQWPKE